MTEDKSTLRPWAVRDREIVAGGLVVAMTAGFPLNGSPNENAALIVSAVNSHDAMKECVEALRDARNYVDASSLNITSKDGRRNYRGCLARIDSALAKVSADLNPKG